MPTPYLYQVRVKRDSSAPVWLAASELRRCLILMTGQNVSIKYVDRFEKDEEPAILVGMREYLSGFLGADECPENQLDDEILVTQRKGNCLVTGSNPRSVLFAAYDLLEELGARWVAPGHLGEVLPSSDCHGLFDIEANEKASYRHRGVCIEGAPSLEHALGMIDWMAKHKMNTFFLQFKTSIYFWSNYYLREYNPTHGNPEEVDELRSLELDGEVIEAAKLRGFVLHRVGHGWTAESLGFKGLGWWRADREPDDETRELLALVKGTRGFFGDVPINTELCYSNPVAFKGIVDEIVHYAEEHPEVDALHFWLSDATNNFCECESCRRSSPTDWYAKLLEAVRREIAGKGLGTRVVFLCYTNTLTPPREEEFEDEDGLIYMFAPISRCYVHPLADPSCAGAGRSGGWPLNRVKAPRTNSEFVEIRRAWREAFSGDSFIFDYYLWAPYLRDMNPLGFARLIAADIRSYEELDLNGLVSCQALRAFYPAGLQMSVMASVLWDREADSERIISDQLSACFGDESGMVEEYLEALDEVLSPSETEPHKSSLRSGEANWIRPILKLVEEQGARLEGLKGDDGTGKRFSDLLKHFNRLLQLRARVALLEAEGKTEEAEKVSRELGEFLRGTENLTGRYLDLWLLLNALHL
jgi:hypothetical protein